MNELKEITKDKVVNVRQTKHEKQNKLIGQFKPHKGHKIWEYNVETNELKEAEMEVVVKGWDVKGNPTTQKKIQANKHCLYISALNEKNAIKRLKKRYA